MKQDSAWLIEFSNGRVSLYFCGSFALGTASNAVRFSREEDARRTFNFLKANNFVFGDMNAIISEHVWA